MKKTEYLNVGCGNKFHPAWVNVDMVSTSPHVKAVNLLKGIPFPDNSFEAVYHSQVLEHIPKENAAFFIRECLRVLKPGGILRVVVPDLENIVSEYSRLLKENLENPTETSAASYDWIMLEMYDQTVRSESGGQMAAYLKQPQLVNEKYILDRIGFVGRTLRNANLDANPGQGTTAGIKKAFSSWSMLRHALKKVAQKAWRRFGNLNKSKAAKLGAFRMGGEIHMWMYDRYSLSRLLSACGFTDVSVKNPYESDIVDWQKYELDVKDGLPYDPTSLFIEAKKSQG